MRTSVDIEKIIEIAQEAGKAILEVYDRDFEVEIKDDNSPLTEADQRSNAVIIEGLEKHYADIPIISEETKEVAYDERKEWNTLWLVDPLDGTKEFIKKNGEFTVNIALVEDGVPVLGVVYIPVESKTYYGTDDAGSFMRTGDGQTVKLENRPHYSELEEVKVVASRSHLSDEVVAFVDDLREKGKKVDFLSAGSSLKFCLVAEGKADVYPRLGPTMEWDTGAAHAVVLGAGLNVNRHDTGKPLNYNKENLLNPWFIVE